ncbi:nuclease A inhibitor family protein [Microscilla marina]|uniref:Nuclease A inhibitor-like protein n=1 Tax=Microscilla marina ATCC 23134 TaxID=313606 RepID=A1ZZA8_MICM2|nr:nuclease A inhibitor family protein [Microscilla marina]EAY24260.1 hypothetical protein M23134_03646 [Microscilla marina ATCC 23134]
MATDEQENLLKTLDRASDGLMFMSESDYPFESFYWDFKEELTANKVLTLANEAPDAIVKELKLDAFLKNSVAEESWYDAKETKVARQFQRLVETLKRNLQELRVFRVGGAEADVYIVGKAEFGGYAGLVTHVVQT